YKIAGDWEVVDGLRARAGFNRAVRDPNIVNPFAPQNVVLDGTTDPCAGLTASNPLVAKCAQAFNLTTAQVLAIEKNPAPQYNGLTGGNPNLKPETADSYTAGFVYQPSFLPGFNASVDYFNIKVEDAIGGVGADLAITRCLSTLDPFFCGLVKRDAQGSLWLSNQGYIINTTLNTGSTSTAGVDVNLGYRRDLADLGLGDYGSLSVDFVGTWLDYLKTEPLPGDPEYDCVKLYGTVCGTPNPEWRHKFRVNWATPFWGDLQVGMQWRYFSKVTLDALLGPAAQQRRPPVSDRQGTGGPELLRPAGQLQGEGQLHDPCGRQQRPGRGSAAYGRQRLPDRLLQRQHLSAGVRRRGSLHVHRPQGRLLILTP
ncbi:MAG: TonB-dependent receptor domain-containing protein, partial [Phenylobacterium sp.]